MDVIDCKYCKREIPSDSMLCPYCGKVFNKIQNFIDTQKEKQRKIITTNVTKMKLLDRAFKPVELQISNVGRSERSYKKPKKDSKSKLLMYFLIFSMFVTLIVVMAVVFESII